MDSVLDVRTKKPRRDAISGRAIISYKAQTERFDYNDVIRIPAPHSEWPFLVAESLLEISGQIERVTPGTGDNTTRLDNHALAALFSQVSLEINGTEVDECKDCCVTSSMKTILSASPDDTNKMRTVAWTLPTAATSDWMLDSNLRFKGELPLRMLLGFAEDYHAIVVNARLDLVLVRARDDSDALKYPATDPIPSTIRIGEIKWRVPHIKPSLQGQVTIYEILNDSRPINLNFRKWELVTDPHVPKSRVRTWNVRTTSAGQIPLFVCMGFQTDRRLSKTKSASEFDHINLTSCRLYLNADSYPHETLNFSFKNNKYSELYRQYAAFQEAYYGYASSPLLSPEEYKTKAPLVVWDVSQHELSATQPTVQVRIDYETEEDIPEKTFAHCLIIYRQYFVYQPLTRAVVKAPEE